MPRTYTTEECVARAIRRSTAAGGAALLSAYVARVRREDRPEVRRLRRALRKIVKQDTPPKNAVPETCWECGETITEGENIEGVVLCCYGCVAVQHATMRYIASAALAPRRKKP